MTREEMQTMRRHITEMRNEMRQILARKIEPYKGISPHWRRKREVVSLSLADVLGEIEHDGVHYILGLYVRAAAPWGWVTQCCKWLQKLLMQKGREEIEAIALAVSATGVWVVKGEWTKYPPKFLAWQRRQEEIPIDLLYELHKRALDVIREKFASPTKEVSEMRMVVNLNESFSCPFCRKAYHLEADDGAIVVVPHDDECVCVHLDVEILPVGDHWEVYFYSS